MPPQRRPRRADGARQNATALSIFLSFALSPLLHFPSTPELSHLRLGGTPECAREEVRGRGERKGDREAWSMMMRRRTRQGVRGKD